MSGPFLSATTAITALWDAQWALTGETVPVRWHHNSNEKIPAIAANPHWLHLAVEFREEGVVAFGGGRGANECELTGSVVIRSNAAKGLGETECLRLLDAARGCFRSRRVGGLSFIGTSVLRDPGASEDGAWWIRSGIVVFVYRFQG